MLPGSEGGATVHSSQLLHAVSRMTSGVRYSLILFFDRTGAPRHGYRWTEQRGGGGKDNGQNKDLVVIAELSLSYLV